MKKKIKNPKINKTSLKICCGENRKGADRGRISFQTTKIKWLIGTQTSNIPKRITEIFLVSRASIRAKINS